MASMLAGRSGRERQSLLSSYTDRLHDALYRQQSAVALRAARVDAELALRARGAFLASMNHELRTPLNAITGFAGLLKQTGHADLPESQRNEYLDYILQSADLLLSHINTILEIADAESGGSKLSRRAFDLVSVLEQTIADAAEVTDRLDILTDLPDRIPPVDADPDRIAAAMRHLLEFVVTALDGPGGLRITVRQGLAGASADFVYIAMECDELRDIQDEIAAAMRVFDHVHEGLDRKFDTRRLGLPIAKSNIELNGGRFNIKTSVGGGTLIRFALPVARQMQDTFERLVS
jgi:signal transduction histidine kinase